MKEWRVLELWCLMPCSTIYQLLVSSTNKIDRHYTTEILLKVALKHHKPQCYVIKFKLLVVFSTNKT
jgi:hypothetical protein